MQKPEYLKADEVHKSGKKILHLAKEIREASWKRWQLNWLRQIKKKIERI